MKTQFYILLSQRTSDGMESFGRFFIGDDHDRAHEIFAQLQGNAEIGEDNTLFLDFMETKDGFPVNLKMKSCTLEQLGENCKLIAREIFKSNWLRASP